MSEPKIRVETYRPKAERTWSVQSGSIRSITVQRENGGVMKIWTDRPDPIEISADMVPAFTQMVDAAAAWSESEDTVAG